MSYDGEMCQECGLPVSLGIGGTFWSAPNRLWNLIMGGPDAKDDPGGTLCPRCFTLACRAQGIHVSWHPQEYGLVEGDAQPPANPSYRLDKRGQPVEGGDVT